MRVDVAYLSSDVLPEFGKAFFSATRKASNLKWLHVYIAGVDHPVYASIIERGVNLTTSSGANAEPVAHTAIAGLLSLARGFPRWAADQQARRWSPARASNQPRDLRGQVMLIYGLGNIGSEIARLAGALGMRVIGVRRSAVKTATVDEIHAPDKLNDLLPKCDWITLACPLSDETRGLVNAAMLAKLPRGAHVINISRGEVIDEKALVAALGSGQVGGAYLDVFEREPLPADSPLWEMPNVIISPHNASSSAGNDARCNAIFLDNLKRWKHHEPLANEVKSL
jgi:phosphoglycerate dehydrogenase-like enzyme